MRIRLNLPYDLIRLILCSNSELRGDLLTVLYGDYIKDKTLSAIYWQILRSLLHPDAFDLNFKKIFLNTSLEDQEEHHVDKE